MIKDKKVLKTKTPSRRKFFKAAAATGVAAVAASSLAAPAVAAEIVEAAMVEALKNEKIFSLGLDVYNGEPNIHPEYLKLPNVFVLPHLGSSTLKTRTAMANLAVKNLDEFFKSGKCKNKVN